MRVSGQLSSLTSAVRRRQDWDTAVGACDVHAVKDVKLFVSLCLYAAMCLCELEPINSYMSACWPYLHTCGDHSHVKASLSMYISCMRKM